MLDLVIILLLVGAGALCVRLGRTLARWTELRLALTYDLVERMAGHRTLVAQQPPELRHAGEEDALAAYDAASRSMDGASAMLAGFVPRAWLFAGIAVLAPALATSAFGPGANGPLVVVEDLRASGAPDPARLREQLWFR